MDVAMKDKADGIKTAAGDLDTWAAAFTQSNRVQAGFASRPATDPDRKKGDELRRRLLGDAPDDLANILDGLNELAAKIGTAGLDSQAGPERPDTLEALLATVSPRPAQPPVDGVTWTDRAADALVVAFVMFSGLSALYYSNAPFGTTGDYVGLLIWATGVKQAFEIAKRLPFVTR